MKETNIALQMEMFTHAFSCSKPSVYRVERKWKIKKLR